MYKQVFEEITSYIAETLKEHNMDTEDFLKHLSICPLCHVQIIECPFCGERTPLDFKCHACSKVMPLDKILEKLGKQMSPRARI